MLCDQCHNREAVMRYTVVRDGKSEEHHLCGQCASEKGLAGQIGAAVSSLGQLLDGMVREMASDGGQDTACPGCGLKLSEFRTGGRLGCGDCYQAFAPVLRKMIRQIHGNGRHLGKARGRAAEAAGPAAADRLGALRSELAQAVGREEFELAASLRDRIRLLEAGKNHGPAG